MEWLRTLPLILAAAVLLVYGGYVESESPVKDGTLMGAGLVLMGVWAGTVVAEVFGATTRGRRQQQEADAARDQQIMAP